MPLCRLAVLLPFLSANPASAQGIREFQLHGLSTFASESFIGGGVGLGLRPPGRMGFLFGALGGALGDTPAGRGEALAIFRLNPYAVTGVTPYGGAGVAVVATRARADGYLVLVLGVESRPAGRAGWFLEAGVGGGVRLAAGLRVRTRLTRRR